MLLRMLSNDIRRNKVVTTTLFLFILLSALLLSGAVHIIHELFGAMNSLFEDSQVPHFVQMHSGDLVQEDIDTFTQHNTGITAQQTHEMLNIPSSCVFFGDSETSEAASVVDISFVTQNNSFDFLLDLNGNKLKMKDGEVAVPIYYMTTTKLSVGDNIRIQSGGLDRTFTIAAFVRDAQMNPSLVTSKRFVVSEADWNTLKSEDFGSEYLIEFLLDDPAGAGELERLYHSSNLPRTGASLTLSLYQMLNAVTDGLVAAVLILVSLLLTAIALLCLRYTMVASMEEDTREIGVLKSIGVGSAGIRRIYLTKYMALAGLGSLVGYLLSLPLKHIFTANISLYMGKAPASIQGYLLPLLGAVIVCLLVVLSASLVLRKHCRISPVQAIRFGTVGQKSGLVNRLAVHKSSFPLLNIFLGARDVITRFSNYVTLFLVFIVCAFLAITPLNLYTTIQSPDFIRYMGAGQSDLRIDLQSGRTGMTQYQDILSQLKGDTDISKFAGFATGSWEVVLADDTTQDLRIESGDFSVFPVEYQTGAAPSQSGQIALSAMNADELEKNVADTLILNTPQGPITMTVCGIYQDVTNGGKTAKALLDPDEENVLWHVIYVNLASDANAEVKKSIYADVFTAAKVLNMTEYLGQTLGPLAKQLQRAAIAGVFAATLLCFLVTALYLKMTFAKEARELSTARCLGFSSRHLRSQYLTRVLSALLINILLGTLAAATLGQGIAGILFSAMGASTIEFTVNPLISYILLPMLLVGAVLSAALLSSRQLNKIDRLHLAAE